MSWFRIYLIQGLILFDTIYFPLPPPKKNNKKEGTYKVRNEIETKRNQRKRNETKRDEMKTK